MSDDFKDHPKSISEIKYDKGIDRLALTPRDILVDLLRKIDSGELQMSNLVVGFVDQNREIRFSDCCTTRLTSIGLWHSGAHAVLNDV